MQKIMFNNKYRLTQAVLDGSKTNTRRIAYIGDIKNASVGFITDGKERGTCVLCDGSSIVARSAYKIGEEVAIAQSYKDCLSDSWIKYIHKVDPNVSYDRDLIFCPGNENKMFVRADLMPHRIRITNIRIERLQDISEEDCLKEGIVCKNGRYRVETYKGVTFYTTDARQAFAYLIDKVSGKGTWDSNPYVFVYEFELIK